MKSNPITKAEEIAILQKCALELGPESYSGAWLLSVLAEVQSNLASDFVPVMTIGDAHRAARWTREAAEADAAAILERAKAEAEKMRAAGMNARNGAIQRAAAALRESLRDLENT